MIDRQLPPMYCITCTQTPERTHAAEAHFTARGLPVQMVQGIHGRTWGLETALWSHRDGAGYRMPPGHVGLCLSHWMLWQHCLLAGHDEAIIMEDDVEVIPDFRDSYWRTYDALPSDWQLLFVGTFGAHQKERRRVNGRLVVIDMPFGTHCYLVRRSALPVLLETCQEAKHHIDLKMGRDALPRLRHYTAWPSMAAQHTAEGRWPGSVH